MNTSSAHGRMLRRAMAATASTVADRSFLGGGDFSAEVAYFCPTGNISGFQGRTYSEITLGGQEYKASAYDGTEGGGFYRYNCG